MAPVELIRIGLGVRSLTERPSRAFGRPASGVEGGVLRFLGVRQVVQGVVVGRTGWHALSASVDLLHGSSMVLLAIAQPRRYGKAAGAQALTAAVLVALEVAASRRG
ncbi:hypothetical protein [Amnibacterium endophyticum]|uniref:Uncharacterized protein n=1 Tax=Amnibacterium endophyticum TaxID=2109337 RepID=A0ABW4LHS6_9MICO